mmetsp:Transcript_5012/g.7617  ORF Transcript_5012/g.7617 Transcript_5012/m.7617 type:complete len:103 (+) Transcript_5012:1-309(+)
MFKIYIEKDQVVVLHTCAVLSQNINMLVGSKAWVQKQLSPGFVQIEQPSTWAVHRILGDEILPGPSQAFGGRFAAGPLFHILSGFLAITCLAENAHTREKQD